MSFFNPSSLTCLGACFVVFWSKIRCVLMPVMSSFMLPNVQTVNIMFSCCCQLWRLIKPFLIARESYRRGKYDEQAVSYSNALWHRALACIGKPPGTFRLLLHSTQLMHELRPRLLWKLPAPITPRMFY